MNKKIEKLKKGLKSKVKIDRTQHRLPRTTAVNGPRGLTLLSRKCPIKSVQTTGGCSAVLLNIRTQSWTIFQANFLEGPGFFVAQHPPKCPQPIFEGFLWVYPAPRVSYIALFSVLVQACPAQVIFVGTLVTCTTVFPYITRPPGRARAQLYMMSADVHYQ